MGLFNLFDASKVKAALRRVVRTESLKARTAQARRPLPSQLTLETLEERCTPAILFTPQSGTPTVSDGGGQVLSNARVHLIFWGSAWGSSTTPSIANVENATRSLISSGYLADLGQYRPGLGSAVFVESAWDTSNPASGFSRDAIQDVVKRTIDREFADPDDTHHPVYLVVTPPGVNSSVSNAAGWHSQFTFHDNFLDWDTVAFGWVGNGGSLDGIMDTLSHELVEAMTNPDVRTGLTATTGGSNELSDGEAQNFTYRVNGVLAQSYWSAVDGAYVVPNGDVQDFILNNGQLIVNGDQLGSPDDTITVSASGSQVQVTINGELEMFPTGLVRSVVVNSGRGVDTISVQRTLSGVPVTINAGAGNDTIQVGNAGDMTPLLGALRIDGGADNDSVFFNDQNSAAVGRTYHMVGHNADPTDSFQIFRRTGAGETRFAVETVTVNAGAGNDTLNIERSGASRSFFNAGPGNDTINFGYVGYTYWHGGATVDGQGGTNTFNFLNTDDTTGRTYTLAMAGDFTRVESPTLFATFPLAYARMQTVNLHFGNGGDTIQVNGTAAGSTTTVFARGGNDVVRVAPLPAGSIRVDGGDGTDTLDYSSYTATQPVVVNLVNGTATSVTQGVANLENVTGGAGNDSLTGSTAANILLGGAGGDYLDGHTGSDRLEGGSGDDTYGFGVPTSAAGETDTVVELAGGGSDTLDFRNLTVGVTVNLSGNGTALGSHAGRTLLVGTAGQAANLENVTGGAGNDSLTGSTAANILLGGAGGDYLDGHTGSDRLEGGSGDDTYGFGVPTSAAGETDTVVELAGGGSDTLDFRNLTVGVTVNLSGNGTALGSHAGRTLLVGTAGQAANLENAIGGAGNDTLTGNTGANILIGGPGADSLFGGAGRDLLIGGSGADIVNGGAGEDIAIGGSTVHDANVAALQAILAEWNSSRTYLERIRNLTNVNNPTFPARLNGTSFLLPNYGSRNAGPNATVFDDDIRDTLRGDGDRDWFFAVLGSGTLTDVLSDRATDEETH